MMLDIEKNADESIFLFIKAQINLYYFYIDTKLSLRAVNFTPMASKRDFVHNLSLCLCKCVKHFAFQM